MLTASQPLPPNRSCTGLMTGGGKRRGGGGGEGGGKTTSEIKKEDGPAQSTAHCALHQHGGGEAN